MGGTKTNVAKETNGNLDAIKTAVQLLDNAIAGSEMQVDIVASLPAGTNAIGKLSANSGVDIGDVDVTSLPALPTGTNSIGQVTANAGTNLNTSALALEATQYANFNLLGAIDAATASTNDNTGYTVARLDSILARTTVDQDLRNDSTDMTVTGLNSLASSATVGWQSDRVAIGTELDVLVSIKLDMANTAPANDKMVYVYLCPWFYDGSTWYGASLGTATLPTGSQGACTIASAAPNNLKLLGTLAYSTADMVLQDSFLLSNVYGSNMPDAWSIVVINYSGAAVAASSNKLMYKKINQQTV